MLMSKGVLYSRPQKKTCQSSYFPALGLFGDYLYIKLKMSGISRLSKVQDFEPTKQTGLFHNAPEKEIIWNLWRTSSFIQALCKRKFVKEDG